MEISSVLWWRLMDYTIPSLFLSQSDFFYLLIVGADGYCCT